MGELRVRKAQPYASGCLSSFSRDVNVLIRQFQFPNEYSRFDTLISADSDRIFSWGPMHFDRCLRAHIGTGIMGLANWVKEASHEDVISFLVDALKADASVQWTGYRVLGSVHIANGYPVWTLQLFAKSEYSTTLVYSDEDAPNVNLPRHAVLS